MPRSSGERPVAAGRGSPPRCRREAAASSTRTARSRAADAYRLGYRQGGSARTSPETWVDVPGRLAFGLQAPRPNPGSGDLVVSFTLPSDAPALLEVLDVGGRRALAREVGSWGIGTHHVKLARGELRAGLYHVTLTQAGRRATARVVVIP